MASFLSGEFVQAIEDKDGTQRILLKQDNVSEINYPLSTNDSITIEFQSSGQKPAYSFIK